MPEAGPKRVRDISKRLYTGQAQRGAPLGEVLKHMAREGRTIQKEQQNRWDINRAFFRGEQHLAVNPASNSVRNLTRSPTFGQGGTHETFNRLRQFTEGRVAMMTGEKPSFTVDPPDTDKESIDAARLATKFLRAMWDQEGWRVQEFITKLATTAEIDGISFAYVGWNPHKGVRRGVPVLTAEGMQFIMEEGDELQKALVSSFMQVGASPVLDRRLYEFLREADPSGGNLWETKYDRLGDVEFRVVRPGSLAIDPFASSAEEPRWIIESTVLPRSEIERMAGKDLKKLLEDQKQVIMDTAGTSTHSNQQMPDVRIDDGDPKGRSLPGNEAMVCHRGYVLPNGDFPMGLHCFWVDKIPHIPLIMEPYDEDELPYRAYVPKPDYGHFLRSRATVDDLMPMQMSLNRTLEQIQVYLDRVGNPPIAMPRGALVSKSIYNEDGYFEYHPGLGEGIHYFNAPGEPTAVLSNHIQWIEMQMAEVAAQSASARGQTTSNSPESAIGIQMQIQQSEQQLSGTEAALKVLIEWACSRALNLVAQHYTLPRMVAAPGVDSTAELRSFTGELIRGSHRFRIDGSLLPKSKAAQWQAMMQFIPMLGPEVRPWIADFLTGDIEEFKSHERANKERQKRENQQMAALAANPQARIVYKQFSEMLQRYMEAIQKLQAMVNMQSSPEMTEPGTPAGQSKMNNAQMMLTQAMNMPPPKLTEMLRAAKLPVPTVEDFDQHETHIMEMDSWAVSDGYDIHPEMVKQLAREHKETHIAMMSRNMMQLGGGAPPPGGPGQGSAPAEKGQPSPPSQKGQPASAPPQSAPPGGAGGGPPGMPSGG